MLQPSLAMTVIELSIKYLGLVRLIFLNMS
jgi:hypothetical protein